MRVWHVRATLMSSQAERLRDYKDVALTYYNLTTAIFHKIWGPHYSMGLQFPCENLSTGGEACLAWSARLS